MLTHSGALRLIRAGPGHAGVLSEIAYAAKAHWGYPARRLEIWRPELTISAEYIRRNPVVIAVVEERPVGFYALVVGWPSAWLDHLWVLPEYHGVGVGRGLFQDAAGLARSLGASALLIEADPHAESFYAHLGAQRVGERASEPEGQLLSLPLLRLDLAGQPFLPMLEVNPAQPNDIDSVMSILAETSAALVRSGINQWPSPPSPSLWRLIEQQIALGQVHLARLPRTGELAGTVRFTAQHVPVWPENHDQAGYLHTFAIRPALSGRQLGVALMHWSVGHGRAQSWRWLRLDCVASSRPLRQYYERLGFVDCGVVAVGGYELARYELVLQASGTG
jgi:GNAT superfamily N-acetyltransferase